MVFFLILFYFLFLSCLYLGGKPNTQLRKEPGNNLNVFCSSILCEKKKDFLLFEPRIYGIYKLLVKHTRALQGHYSALLQ